MFSFIIIHLRLDTTGYRCIIFSDIFVDINIQIMDLAEEKLVTCTSQSEAHIGEIRDKLEGLSEKWAIQNEVRFICTLLL